MVQMPQAKWLPDKLTPVQIVDRITERKLRTPSADELIEAGQNYIRFCEQNPTHVQKPMAFKGASWNHIVDKPRCPTIEGFTLFCSISERTLKRWRDDERFPDLQQAVQTVIKTFQDVMLRYGMADVANANLIARYLGLSEKTQTEVVGGDTAPAVDPTHAAVLTHPDMEVDQLEQLLERGLPVPMFSQAQIDAGIPFFMPKMVDVIEHVDVDPIGD